MLIRWATEEERQKFGYPESDFGEYDVLAAIDRMSDTVIGIVGFCCEEKTIGEPQIFAPARAREITDKLIFCADRQCHPKGRSFHYRYENYAKESQEKYCPCCNGEPAPTNHRDIAELKFAWVTAERVAQGRLFGKCHVLCKKHFNHLFDMPTDDLAGFMGDVQAAAKALQDVTGAVKINYEIHGNTGPHLHCHLFPRYLDDDFPGQGIDVNLTEPSPYESDEEFDWFVAKMKEQLL